MSNGPHKYFITKWLTCPTCEYKFSSEILSCPFCAREEREEMKIIDSGERTEFHGGAVRDIQKGKGRMDLLPPWAIEELSKVFEAGAEKYEARNWERGIPVSRFIDSGLRHALKFLRGDVDEPHLAQACWNFMCCLDTIKRIDMGILPEDLNDLPFLSRGN